MTLEDGTWTATWGRWVILLRREEAGWIASVWALSPSLRVEDEAPIAQAGPFARALDAGEWAGDVVRTHGAPSTMSTRLMKAPRPQALASILDFRPAPATAR